MVKRDLRVGMVVTVQDNPATINDGTSGMRGVVCGIKGNVAWLAATAWYDQEGMATPKLFNVMIAWLDPLVLEGTQTDKKTIGIKCTYFKFSGKYYLDGEEQFPKHYFAACHYPSEYGLILRSLRKLPGLQSGYWDQYFTVEVEDKYTELVTPDSMDRS